MFAQEVAGRERPALAARRAAAEFPTAKTFAAWQPDATWIPAPTQQALRTLEWVHRRENLVVCGPAGTGKTFLLEALGQHAVEQGLKVAWFTLEALGVLLRRHRAGDTVTKAIARLVDAAYENRSVAISTICTLPGSTSSTQDIRRRCRGPPHLQRPHHQHRHRVLPPQRHPHRLSATRTAEEVRPRQLA